MSELQDILSDITITNTQGDWIWRGKLAPLQVFDLAKLADKFSDENETPSDKGIWHGQRETLESVFMGLPDGCMLKTPNNFNEKYTVTYKENSRNSLKTSGETPKEAVIRMAELLAQPPQPIDRIKE